MIHGFTTLAGIVGLEPTLGRRRIWCLTSLTIFQKFTFSYPYKLPLSAILSTTNPAIIDLFFPTSYAKIHLESRPYGGIYRPCVGKLSSGDWAYIIIFFLYQ